MARIESIALLLRGGGLAALLAVLLLPGVAQGQETPVMLPLYPAEGAGSPVVALYPVADVGCPVVPFAMTGSWQHVNEGKASPWDYALVDTRPMIAALGAGTTDLYRATGDMLSFAGRTFIRTTNPKTGVRLVEVTKPFRTPCMMGIPAPEAVVIPQAYRLRGEQPLPLNTLLQALAVDAGGPIGVLGWVAMPELKALGLKKAPIDNVPLFGARHRECFDAIEKTEASVVFVAIVTPPPTPRTPLNTNLLARRVFGRDTASGVAVDGQLVAMGAQVAQPIPLDYFTRPAVITDLRDVTVQDIFRVQEQSTVRQGTLFVYRLDVLNK